MKRAMGTESRKRKSRKFATALAILSAAAFLTGCGNGQSDVPPPVAGFPGPQFPGFPGGNGSCIPLVQGFYGGQQAPLGFQANGMYFDGRVLRAGHIPGNSQPYGQVMVMQGGQGGPYTRSGVDGTVSINIQNMGQIGGGYPQPGTYYPGQVGGASTANATGIVQISQMTVNDILAKFGGGMQQPTYPTYPGQPGYMPQPNPYQPTTCVSGIAIDLQWSPQYNMLYGGWVYLYLNNTQSGYKLFF